MAIHVVRLGSPRAPNEGVRLGTVRRPPRGVAKQDFARRDYYDVWLPILAPSAELLSFAHAAEWTDSRWRQYARRYQREMNRPEARQLIEMLAALSNQAHFAVGCYCEDATRCHRSLLSTLLKARGALVVDRN